MHRHGAEPTLFTEPEQGSRIHIVYTETFSTSGAGSIPVCHGIRQPPGQQEPALPAKRLPV
jgi:hypothetical protein